MHFTFSANAVWLYRVHQANIHRQSWRQFLLVLQVVEKYIPKHYWDSFGWDLTVFDTIDQLAMAKSELSRRFDPGLADKISLKLQRAMLRSARKERDKSALLRALGSSQFSTSQKAYAVLCLFNLAIRKRKIKR
jgi:hypothetical protein